MRGLEPLGGLDSSLTLQALEMTRSSREVCPGLIHHLEKMGSLQTPSVIHRLYEVGARISMAAVGNPYQNAKASSFLKTLKTKEVYSNDYQMLEEAQAN
jgi:putative transposase